MPRRRTAACADLPLTALPNRYSVQPFAFRLRGIIVKRIDLSYAPARPKQGQAVIFFVQLLAVESIPEVVHRLGKILLPKYSPARSDRAKRIAILMQDLKELMRLLKLLGAHVAQRLGQAQKPSLLGIVRKLDQLGHIRDCLLPKGVPVQMPAAALQQLS